MNERQQVLAIVLGVVAVVIVVVVLEWDKISAAIKGGSGGQTSGGTSGTGGGGQSTGSGGTSNVGGTPNYPVTTASPASDILQAFKDSGYWAQLNATQRANAAANPSVWLQQHPYLYTVYPEYFTQA